MNQQAAENGAAMTAKAAPPLTVVGANIAGIPVSDWVQWATLIYICLQLFFLVKDRLKKRRERKKNEPAK